MEFSRQESWSACHSPLQGTFLTQGWNLGVLHCMQILYRLRHQGSPVQLLRHLESSPGFGVRRDPST